MIYSIEQIAELVKPIAEKYQVSEVYLYGSYARQEANEDSDIDIVYKREGSTVHGLLRMSSFKLDLERALNKKVDIVPLESFDVPIIKERNQKYIDNVHSTEVMLYGA